MAAGLQLLTLQLLGGVRFAFPSANAQENWGQILLRHRAPASPALVAPKPRAPAMFVTLLGVGLAFRSLCAEIPKLLFRSFLCGARSASGVVLPSGCVNRFSKPARGENTFPATPF